EEMVAVVGELACQRLPARRPRPVGRIDAARARAELGPGAAPDDRRRRRRAASGAVDERQAAIGAEQEDLADVAAGLAAVLVVHRVDLAPVVRWATEGLNRRDQLVQRLRRVDDAVVRRPVAVLHLLAR